MAACRHSDIQRFGDMRSCLSCGETIFDTKPEPTRLPLPYDSVQYRYRPFEHGLGEEIRLVLLHAGSYWDELICDIVVVNLADRPVYEALSYTWADSSGDASLSSKLACLDHIIPITNNCDAALRRLRPQNGKRRRLWIDAISINQFDATEKSHQVRLMSQIYANASQVLAYLGIPPAMETAKFRRLINYLQEDTPVALEMTHLKNTLMDFLGLPYFDRVWILQEVGLSRLVTFIIGARELRWTGATASKMLDLCSALGVRAPSILRWSPARRPEEELDVLAVLSKSRNCSATNARDKVYALLGLIHPAFSAKFPIDYSLSVSEVYTKLAVGCLHEGRLDVLQHCRSAYKSESQPTWVPRWNIKAGYEPSPAQFSETQKHSYATTWTPLSYDDPSSWLRVKLLQRPLIEEFHEWLASDQESGIGIENMSTAVCCRLVAKWSIIRSKDDMSPRIISPKGIQGLVHEIMYAQSQNFTFKILQPTSLQLSDVSRTISASELQSTSYLKIRAHRLDKITRVVGRISNAHTFQLPRTSGLALGSQACRNCINSDVSPLTEDTIQKERRELLSNIEIHGAGATAFVTDYSIGFARGDAKFGLSVWAIYGTDVPFLLREWKEHYTFLGDCYLHRAGRPFPCKHCGADVAPWPLETEIIDIW